jgi:hypothetical protein
MPPVYRQVKVRGHYDGSTNVDLRPLGINLVYYRDWLPVELRDRYYQELSSDPAILKQHSYRGNFNRQITPHRLTHAHVPERERYRYRGRDLDCRPSELFGDIFDQLVDRLPEEITVRPNASISNGYRFNGDDYIAPHTDDEKFLEKRTCSYWEDPTVCTLTLLERDDQPMTYYIGNPETGIGYSLMPRHGSLTIQGTVLHEIRPVRSTRPATIARISVTLRRLVETCSHGETCPKPNCLPNLGASNYLYYSNRDAVEKNGAQLDYDEEISGQTLNYAEEIE